MEAATSSDDLILRIGNLVEEKGERMNAELYLISACLI